MQTKQGRKMGNLNARYAIPPLPKELADVELMDTEKVIQVTERVRFRQRRLSMLRQSYYHPPSFYPLFLGGLFWSMGQNDRLDIDVLGDNFAPDSDPFAADQRELSLDAAAVCGDVWLGFLRHTRL